MAGNSTISITYKLEGDNGGFKKLTVDAEGLRKVLGGTVNQAEKLKTSIINFAALSAGLDSISQSLNTLQAKFKELSDAYAVQETAERKLETVMRQRMGATDAEIDSIKKLASAQQEIGVIGDEVQLSGAQQVATFLKEKASLDVLLPAMNNLLAQQKGLNATTQDAVQVGNLMGKAMQGQTGALTRVGITFTAAQEQVMKFGTESERAAMLAQIITDNVGNMNQQLAQTDSGKQKQLEHALGDVKDKMGALVSGSLPYVTIAANTMLALTATMKFVAGIRVAVLAVKKFFASGKIMGAAMTMIGVQGKSLTFIMRAFSSAVHGGIGKVVAMKVALRGLMIVSGIGVAFAAITSIIGYFTSSVDKATDGVDKLTDAEERAKQNAEALEQARQQETAALSETRADLDLNISKLKEFNGTKEEEKKLVNEMNNTYGEAMGYFSSVADWYNALISNSEAYCRQMVIEARTRNIANQISQKEQEIHDTLYDSNGKRRMYTYTSGTYAQSYYNSDGKREVHIQTPTNATTKSWPDFEKEMSQGLWHQDKTDPTIYWRQVSEGKSTPLKEANDLIAENRASVASLIKQLTGLVKEAAGISFRVKGSTTRPDVDTDKDIDKDRGKGKPAAPAGSIGYVDERIQAVTTEIKYEVNPEKRAELYKELEALKSQKVSLEFDYKHPDAPGKLSDLADIKPKIVPEIDASKITPTIKDISDNKPIYRADANNLVLIQENIQSLQDKLQTASIEEAALLNKDIEFWQKKADAIRNAGMTTKDAFAAFSNGWGNIKNVGSGIDSITGALSNNGNAWQKVTGIVDGFLQVFDGIKSIVSLINTLVGVTQLQADAETTKAAAATAATAAQGAEAATADATAAAQVPVIAANKAATASFMELASAAYFAAHASIPFAGFGIASGFVSASAAMVKAAAASVLTPFANGGIVSGPTVGLIGEYAGASSNPEVVAPLDKLRKLINPVGQPVIVGGTLRASGRELVCVLANETRIAGKSGRRTNIKI